MRLAKGTFCAAPGCRHNRGSCPKLSFFKFPKEPERAKQWIINSGRKDFLDKDTFKVHRSYSLCAVHFEDHMFMNELKARLVWNAVPTKFGAEETVRTYSKRQLAFEMEITVTEKRARDMVAADDGVDGAMAETTTIRSEHSYHMSPSMECAVKSAVCGEPVGFAAPPKTPSAPLVPLHISQVIGNAHFPGMSANLMASTRSVGVQVYPQQIEKPIIAPEKLKELRTKLHSKTVEIWRLKKKMQKVMPKRQRDPAKMNVNDAIACVKRFLPESSWDFVSSQMKHARTKARGRRWSDSDKTLAVSVYYQSPKAYLILSKIFSMPNKKTLQRWMSAVSIRCGLGDDLKDALRDKVKALSEQDRLCVICVAEIPIKVNVSYDKNLDELVGFEDDGTVRGHGLVTGALAVMVRGFCSNWKQVIGYSFVSDSAKSLSIGNIVSRSVQWASEADLKVLAVVLDADKNFTAMARDLGVCGETPYVERGEEKLYFVFDHTQLLRAARNVLRHHCLAWSDRKTAWKHVEDFHALDTKQRFRLAPTLTDKQIKLHWLSKKRARVARQVLNHAVAAGIESHITAGAMMQETAATAEFISYMNQLAESCSSLQLKPKEASKQEQQSDDQLEVLLPYDKWLAGLEVFDSKTDDNVTASVDAVYGWRVTVSAFRHLGRDVRDDPRIAANQSRCLSLDLLDNVLDGIARRVPNRKPTPQSFARLFKRECLNELVEPFPCVKSTDNFGTLLLNMSNLNRCGSAIEMVEGEAARMPKEKDERPVVPDLPQENPFLYICSYLAKKCLENHDCEECRIALYCGMNLDMSASNEENLLPVPSDVFGLYVYQCVERLVTEMEAFPYQKAFSAYLLAQLKAVEAPSPCADFPADVVIKHFLQFVIPEALKYANKDFGKGPHKKRKVFRANLNSLLAETNCVVLEEDV